MADDPKLLVVLEARLDKFEKQLKEAGLIAEREMANIERKVSGGALSGSFLGTFFGGLAKQGFNALINAVEATIERFKELRDVSKLTGESIQTIFGFQQAMARLGTPIEVTNRALKTLTTLTDQMQRGEENALTRMLDANPAAMKGLTRETATAIEMLGVVANLIQNARTESEKIEIAKAFGLPPEVVKSLQQGAAAIKLSADAASKATVDLDAVSRDAKEYERIWEETTRKVGGFFAALTKVALHVLTMTAPQGASPFDEAGFADLWKDAAKNKPPGTSTRDPNRPITNIPSSATGGAGRQPFERAKEQLTKTIELEKEHLKTVEEGVAAQEEGRQIALLTAAAKAQGLIPDKAITEELRQQAEQAGRLKLLYVQRQAQLQELNAASKEFGSTLSTAFQELVLQGKKLDEVVRNLTNRLASKAIDKLFDLFFAPQAGASTSIFGALVKGFVPGKAGGGPVLAGRPYMVGEHGPELFMPNRSGLIVPNTGMLTRGAGGGVSVSPVYNIDASGADAAAIARLETALRATNATIEARAVRAVAQHAQRYQ